MITEMQHILKNDRTLVDLIDLLYRNDVTLEKFADYCAEEYIKEVERASKTTKQIKDKDERKNNGVPDYEGMDSTGFGPYA